jgi:hypothetical protein
MRVAIVTAIWKREEVFGIFARNAVKLINSVPDMELKVFCAGSQGEHSQGMAEAYGFDYVEVPNNPLYEKWNVAVRSAKAWRPDYVLMMGSDDVMSAKMLRRYLPSMMQRIDFIGCLDWMFYDLNSGKAIHWKGYNDNERRGKTVGAGRMLSASLLDRLQWQPWAQQVNGEGMDGTMMRRLGKINTYTQRAITTGRELAVDIKSDTNITPFAQWPNSVFIDPTKIKQEFGL